VDGEGHRRAVRWRRDTITMSADIERQMAVMDRSSTEETPHSCEGTLGLGVPCAPISGTKALAAAAGSVNVRSTTPCRPTSSAVEAHALPRQLAGTFTQGSAQLVTLG
jgi:hypothetical protein